MEDVFGRLGEILNPHIHKGNTADMCGCVYVKELYKYGYVFGTDPSEALNKYLSDKNRFYLLNEAERNGDDIIVKKIVYDIFELDDYTLLPTEQTKSDSNE